MTTPAASPGDSAVAGRTFRPELQGLRAVAVILVVVYHVWFNRVSGGVDVFLLITGFLLTGQLLRAADRGSLTLRSQWNRVLSRLVPAAAVVLLGVLVAAAVLLPQSRWSQTLREIIASALFLQNWQLAHDAVDYAAQNNVASVVQHFWSLSIQVQVMLVAPVLVGIVVLTARSAGASVRRHLTILLVGVAVVSLGYSVALTAVNQPYAYFHTLTRLWEFAFGGLLALVIHRIVLTARVRVRLGWIGVVGLVACGMVLQGASVFPGFAALWPTGCAALVLIAGMTGSPWGVDRILASRPLRWLGDLSYSLYLWHWPVLVLVLVSTRQEQLGLVAGLGVIAVSLPLAVLTHRFVELPFARMDPTRLRRLGVSGLAVLLVVAATWQVTATAGRDGTVGDAEHPGALALGADVAEADLLPPPAVVYDDWVDVVAGECVELAGYPADACHLPVDGEPQRHIVVVGDSHMQQFTGALLPIAQRSGWQVTTMLRGACPFSTASEVVPDEPDCLAWNDAVAAELVDLSPDLVVTLASRDVRAGLTEQSPPGFVDRWRQLDAAGIPVLAVRDNPRFDFAPPDCIDQVGRGAPECGIPRDAVYAPDPPYTLHADIPANVTFVDLADLVCEQDLCPAEVGNVLVYLDDNHLSASYARSMAPLLEDVVREASGG